MHKTKKIYLLLNIILFTLSAPYLYLFFTLQNFDFYSVLFAIANISGYLALVFFVFQILIANRPLVKIFTPNIIEVNKYHKFLGIFATIFVFIHPFAEMYVYSESLLFVLMPNLSTDFAISLTFGRIAFFIALIIALTSSVFRKKLAYRNWLKTHYLSYLIVPLVFAHLNEIGTYFTINPIIKNFSTILAITFVIATVYRIAVYFNFTKYKYQVKEIKEYGEDIFTITLSALNKKVTYDPGQYFYLKVEKFFGEEHPFSLLEYKENGDIVFGVKKIGKFSNKMSLLKKEQIVFIEGPFGEFTKEAQNNDPKIIIAGGIGFTPFYELIKNFTSDNTFLFYCNRKIEDALKIMELKKILNNRYFNVLDQDNIKGESIINQRLDMSVIKQNVPKNIINKAKFFLCGSPFFILGLKSLLIENKIDKSKIFYEEFSL